MAAREKLDPQPDNGGGSYFAAPESGLEFINSGCSLLNCVVAGRPFGAWPLGRVSNIVGDKSTGKTLLAIEASANFARQYTSGMIKYREAEAAFDEPYARNLGMPLDRVEFADEKHPVDTVEDFYEDLLQSLEEAKKQKSEGLYILDSLDALSDREEQKRDIDKGSYAMNKAKKLSELFRRLVREIEASRVHVMIISQVRDKIDAMAFGEKTTRAGGRALDFYASQIVYLSLTETLNREINKIKRPVGLTIQAKCKKNKISLPLRVCQFDLMFGFGIDDLGASLDWLREVNHLKKLTKWQDYIGVDGKLGKLLSMIEKLSDADYRQAMRDIGEIVGVVWGDIERNFLPVRRKYE